MTAAVVPAPTERPDVRALCAAARRIEEAVGGVLRGKSEVVRLAVATMLARGHLLIEDIPGVGKTTLARALAAAVGGTFRRIQFTSDLLPSDIVGVTVFDQARSAFSLRRGPIFANVVLADEINRTTPRTQSALLEAMSEGQVSIDDMTHPLEQPFVVLATQNPSEHFGTYPLPESQMDRFLLRVQIGYPARGVEKLIVKDRGSADPVAEIRPVIDHATLRAAQDAVERVAFDDAILEYAMSVIEETRRHTSIAVGVSTRGALAWYRAAQAIALLDGRGYVIPDDVKGSALPALAHRIILAAAHESIGRARSEAERTIAEVLARVPVPV